MGKKERFGMKSTMHPHARTHAGTDGHLVRPGYRLDSPAVQLPAPCVVRKSPSSNSSLKFGWKKKKPGNGYITITAERNLSKNERYLSDPGPYYPGFTLESRYCRTPPAGETKNKTIREKKTRGLSRARSATAVQQEARWGFSRICNRTLCHQNRHAASPGGFIQMDTHVCMHACTHALHARRSKQGGSLRVVVTLLSF